ncbi:MULTISPECIES: alpha/beta fold hydrolase [Kitasatospora]|uniref:Putative thioesterase n=1 Tax=Kitasatospora setae (strain ATCC 33774 / DSM 43861 / JCM 3304 / KCC A-0304 / NBRC 14216 / KM-6054) TaxID=452652 RepID=E4N2D6_KITSK|nr:MULTISPECIES: alpha/beta fold hydrolase [Kitasatospora]BAJ32320.1 putative thioesterase [Kitasatospora setae KM-6054]
MTAEDDWLRRYHPQHPDTPRLVCFPHAGGTAAFWHPLSAALRGRAEVTALQYPGRQDRYAEPLVGDLHALADRIAEVLLPTWLPEPPALLGHSMGALLAYETARRLTEATGREPRLLILSGRRAPHTVRTGEPSLHDASDERLLAHLAKLGGTVGGVLEDPELRELFLPPLRADYRAVETYRYRPGPPLECPVTVLTGDADPQVTADEAVAWAGHTTGPLEVRSYPGGHFYLTAHLESVAALIGDRLTVGVA